jgi:YebC/PmpR family DNA-binding regulatory protein
MAGHSKWAQIKRKKAVTDARRGRLFTRLLREITVAARLGGGEPGGNPRLRSAIDEAKAGSVPKENIERAILKGTGELEGEAFEEIVFEGYGPGGVAVLVETLSDNRNRTVGDLRHLFSKHGGNLGENGCVAWLFEQRGYLAVPRAGLSEQRALELALEIGVEDLGTEEDEVFELFTAPQDYQRVIDELDRRGIPIDARELARIPQSSVRVEGAAAAQLQRLLAALEELDDVQSVWANHELDEARAGEEG